jgi:hypothetical protein
MDEPANRSLDTIPLAAVLELVAMQLEVAMQNAAAQAERLSRSVAEIATGGARLGAHARASGDTALAAHAQAMETEAACAMMAMQFHDQLTQRVTHVRDALGDLHDELLGDGTKDWTALVAKMRAHYTMEDERRLFDLVMWAFPGATGGCEAESLTSSVELF